MKGFIILSIEEKIDQAKDIAKDGFDKNLTIISIVSSIVCALLVGYVVSLFFVKKKQKKSFFNKRDAMKIINKLL